MMKKPANAAEFKRLWARAGLYARAWVRHKASWERITLSAVAYGWGIPTNAEARDFGVSRLDAQNEATRKGRKKS